MVSTQPNREELQLSEKKEMKKENYESSFKLCIKRFLEGQEMFEFFYHFKAWAIFFAML